MDDMGHDQLCHMSTHRSSPPIAIHEVLSMSAIVGWDLPDLSANRNLDTQFHLVTNEPLHLLGDLRCDLRCDIAPSR